MTRHIVTRASQLCRRCTPQPPAQRSSLLPRPLLAPSTAASLTMSSSLPSKRALTTTTPRFATNSASSAASPQPASSEEPASPDADHPLAEPPRTHYDLFPQTLPDGAPPAGHFPIDTRQLRREFLALQSRYHPDLHPPGPLKTRAEAASALINDAYRTLANPLLRAQYLLSLRGVDVVNDETLKIEEPDLLGLVLEAREEIEDAETEAQLEAPRRANDERIRESEEVLERAFRDDDVEAAKREAVRLRYWVNIQDTLADWERGKPVVLQH